MALEGFLIALRDDPTDDATRLVLADWLDDHGDESRAAFIRLSVRLERMDPRDADWPAARAGLQGLLASHQERWLGPAARHLASWSFRGGLVDGITLKTIPDGPDLEGLFRSHPVRHLNSCDPGVILWLARSPVLPALRSLHLDPPLRRLAAGTRRLAVDRLLTSGRLDGVRSLAVLGDAATNYLAHTLPCVPGLAGLRSLRLEGNRIDDGGIVRLLRPGQWPELRDWLVNCPAATSISLARLCRPEWAGRWRSLHWSASGLDRPGDRAGLFRCVGLESLHLDLPVQHSEGSPFAWLGGMPHLTHLVVGRAGPDALRDLANQPALARLRSLEVRLVSAGDGGREEARSILGSSPYRTASLLLKVT